MDLRAFPGPNSIVRQSWLQLHRYVQRSQTTRQFKRLCALILTDRKQQNQRVQLNAGLSYHIKLVAEPPLDSVSSEVLLPEAPLELSEQEARNCWDAFRTADSATAPRTRARERLTFLSRAEEIPETRLKINKPERLSHEQNTRFKWGYGVFRRPSVKSTFPIRFVETSVIMEDFF